MDVRIDRNYVRKAIFDVISLVALGLPILMLNTIATPYQRGFNCDDESIMYPYKDSTIPNYVLYIYGFSIPLSVIFAIEIYNARTKLSTEDEKRSFLWHIYCELVPFFFGVEISQLVTDTAKYSIGRLRPHFLDVCQPDIDCKKIFTPQYFTKYRCYGLDRHKIEDAHLSFMSGHASFSAFCMTYTVFYIQHKLDNRIGLVKKLFQFLLLQIAIYTGFTRISDYKHHWSDVLTGWLQGTIVAILICVYVSKLHRKRVEKFYKPWSKSEDSSIA